jgi:hypothetical protein
MSKTHHLGTVQTGITIFLKYEEISRRFFHPLDGELTVHDYIYAARW